MNYYGAKEMAEAFRTVRKNTLVIAGEIGEEHYGFRVTLDTRTVGEMLVHMAYVPKLTEQIHRVEHLSSLANFDFLGFRATMIADEKTPRTKAEIVALLQEAGDRFSGWLEGLSDDFLGERVEMPAGATPSSKTRFEMILGVKEHEMHHRGQLMVMERLVGIVPHLTREFQTRMAAMAAKR
jgi:uncharacterized damage-inducible protein DinB